MSSRRSSTSFSERTREGLAKARASGRKLGRPKGSLGVSRLDGKEDEIRRFLELGVSKTAIVYQHTNGVYVDALLRGKELFERASEQVAGLCSACACRSGACWPRWNQRIRASFGTRGWCP